MGLGHGWRRFRVRRGDEEVPLPAFARNVVEVVGCLSMVRVAYYGGVSSMQGTAGTRRFLRSTAALFAIFPFL